VLKAPVFKPAMYAPAFNPALKAPDFKSVLKVHGFEPVLKAPGFKPVLNALGFKPVLAAHGFEPILKCLVGALESKVRGTCSQVLLSTSTCVPMTRQPTRTTRIACSPGWAVQVDPIKPTLNAPGTKRLKLKYNGPPSKFAFKFNLRCYNQAVLREGCLSVRLGGAVQVKPMKPVLKAPGSMLLKLRCDGPLSNFAFNFNLRRYTWRNDIRQVCNWYGGAAWHSLTPV